MRAIVLIALCCFTLHLPLQAQCTSAGFVLQDTAMKKYITNDYIITSDFERLDIERFDSVKQQDDEDFYYKEQNDEYYLEIVEYNRKMNGFDRYYIMYLIKNNSYFYTYKMFYGDGNIARKGLHFNAKTYREGSWYYFNVDGKLDSCVYNNKDFAFDFYRLKELVESYGPVLPTGHIGNPAYGYDGINIYREGYPMQNSPHQWAVTYTDEEDNMRGLIIDRTTGKVLSHTNNGPLKF